MQFSLIPTYPWNSQRFVDLVSTSHGIDAENTASEAFMLENGIEPRSLLD